MNNISFVADTACDNPKFEGAFLVSNSSPEFRVIDCCLECKTPTPLIRIREGVKLLPIGLDMANGTIIREDISGVTTTLTNGVGILNFPTALVADSIIRISVQEVGCEANTCDYIVEKYDESKCECDEEVCYISLQSAEIERAGTDSFRLSNLKVLTNTKLKYRLGGGKWITDWTQLPSYNETSKLEIASTTSANCNTTLQLNVARKLPDVVIDPKPCKLYKITNTGSLLLSYTYKNCQGVIVNETLAQGQKICLLALELPILNNSSNEPSQNLVHELRSNFSTTSPTSAPFTYGEMSALGVFTPFTSYAVRGARLCWGNGAFNFPQIGIVDDQGTIAPNRIFMHPNGQVAGTGASLRSDACVRYTASINGFLNILGDSLRPLDTTQPYLTPPVYNLESIITIKKNGVNLYSYSHQTQGASDSFNLTNIPVVIGDVIDILVDSGDASDAGEYSFDHVHVSAKFSLSSSQSSGTVVEDADCNETQVCKSYKIANTSATYIQYTYKSCTDGNAYNNVLQPNTEQCVWSKESPTIVFGVGTITANVCTTPTPPNVPPILLGLGTLTNDYRQFSNWEQDVADFGAKGANAWYADVFLASGDPTFDLAFKNRVNLRNGIEGTWGSVSLFHQLMKGVTKAQQLGMNVIFRFNCQVSADGSFINANELKKTSTGANINGTTAPKQFSGSFSSQDYRDLCVEFATYVLRKAKAISTKVIGCSFGFSAQSEGGFSPTVNSDGTGGLTTFDYSQINKDAFTVETGTTFGSGVGQLQPITEPTSIGVWESLFANPTAIKWQVFNRKKVLDTHKELLTRVKDHFPDVKVFCDFGQGFGRLSMMTHGSGHEDFCSAPFDFFKTNDFERVPASFNPTYQKQGMSVSATINNSTVPIWTEVLIDAKDDNNEPSIGKWSPQMGIEWGRSAYKNTAKAHFIFCDRHSMGVGQGATSPLNYWENASNPQAILPLLQGLASTVFPTYTANPDASGSPDYNWNYLSNWDNKVFSRDVEYLANGGANNGFSANKKVLLS